MNEKKLLTAARVVLEKNWTSTHTKSTSTSIAHQQDWMAAFIALGNAHQDMDKAETELRHIFQGQWDNGMIPHTIYSKEIETQNDIWESKNASLAPKDVHTSGIAAPPIHGFILKRIYDIAKDKKRAKAFVKEIFPKVLASHRFFYENRDFEENGLIYICHPSESSVPTSPTWDSALNKIAVKNQSSQIIQTLKAHQYDASKVESNEAFKVIDPLFNAMLCWSNEALLSIASLLETEVPELSVWHELTIFSMENELWNKEYACFNAFDLVANETILCCSSSAILPLISNTLGDMKALKMLSHLKEPTFGGSEEELTWLCSSYDLEASEVDCAQQCRGAISIHLNWMLYHGLRRYDVDALDQYGPRSMAFKNMATRVKSDSLALINQYGVFEYYDARKSVAQNGLGAEGCALTAALCIDFLLGHTDSNDPS